MKIPVLIAARNESINIGRTVNILTAQRTEVEPIVIVNGSIDDTAETAAKSGATVLESQEGKTVALQAGLRYLGARALEPLLILDADSTPISCNWANRIVESMESADVPVVAWGPLWFTGGRFFSELARTVRSNQILFTDRSRPNYRCVNGSNMAIHIKDEKTLTAILELDNFWQRGDVAIHDVILASGGLRKHILHWQATVKTDGNRLPSIRHRLGLGHEAAHASVSESYDAEAPTGSVDYTIRPVF